MTAPSMLLSYHFWRDRDLDDALSGFPERPVIFGDSGAFSAASIGAEVSLDAYALWLDRWRAHVDVACTLDVIGDGQATWDNTKRLEEHGHRVLPVFHVGEEWSWLERYCESYQYVGLGGQVPWSFQPKKVLRWLVRCFQIAEKTGTVFHGLGQTNPRTLAALPFYSVDSSSWVSAERFGTLTLWDGKKLLSIHPAREPERARALGALIRDHGLDPVAVTDPRYGRPKGGRRLSDDGDKQEQIDARCASLRAWLRLNSWWETRHGPVSTAGLPDGPRVFFVCLDQRQTSTVRQVYLEMAADQGATP
jgi:hypothetical protein